jgi:hypothetical protein
MPILKLDEKVLILQSSLNNTEFHVKVEVKN